MSVVFVILAIVALYYVHRLVKLKEAATLADVAERAERLEWEKVKAEAKARGITPGQLYEQIAEQAEARQQWNMLQEALEERAREREEDSGAPDQREREKRTRKKRSDPPKPNRRWLESGACGWCSSFNIERVSDTIVCHDCGRSCAAPE